MDRGIFDRCIFTNSLLEMGKISEHEGTALSNFLTLPRFVKGVDGVFLFITTPELSISREYKGRLVQQSGRVMNTDFLSELRRASLEEFQKMQK